MKHVSIVRGCKLGLLALALSLTADAALAWCSEPSPPMFKPTKPTVPWCVNEWDNTHTCDDWEIDSYNDEVRRYRRDVEDYVDDLQDYVNDAVEYANCEIESL